MSTWKNAAAALENDVRLAFEVLKCSRDSRIASRTLLKGTGNAEVIVYADVLNIAINQQAGSFNAYIGPRRLKHEWNSVDNVLLALDPSLPIIGPKYRSLTELASQLIRLFDKIVEAFEPASFPTTKTKIKRAAERGVLWIPALRPQPAWARAVISINQRVIAPTKAVLFPGSRDWRSRLDPIGSDHALEDQIRHDMSFLFEKLAATVISNARYRTLDHAIVAVEFESLRLRFIRDRGFVRVEIAPRHLPRDWWPITVALEIIERRTNATTLERDNIGHSRPLDSSLESLITPFSMNDYDETRRRLQDFTDGNLSDAFGDRELTRPTSKD